MRVTARTVCAAAFLFMGVSYLCAQVSDPGQLFHEAVTAQQRGDYSSAIQQYRELVKSKPDFVPAWINLGVALAHVGQLDEAVESYRSALALDPQNQQIKLNLGLAYFKKGDGENAARQFDAVLRTDPKDIRVATLLGASYLQCGENRRALDVLSPLAASAGENSDFLWSFGSALIANGKLRAGVEAVERVAKQTNAAEAWLLAGQNLLRLNEFVRAREDLETAARLNPSLPAVQTALGQAREKNADYQGAISAFRKGVEQNPNDREAWLGLGSDQYFTRDLDGARASLNRLLSLDGASAPGLYALALVDKSQGKFDSAVTEMEQAVKIRPDWLEAHVALAGLYFQLHKTADGARERQIVDRLSEQEQKEGPASK